MDDKLELIVKLMQEQIDIARGCRDIYDIQSPANLGDEDKAIACKCYAKHDEQVAMLESALSSIKEYWRV